MNSYCVISTSIKPSLLVPSKFQKFPASLLDSKGLQSYAFVFCWLWTWKKCSSFSLNFDANFPKRSVIKVIFFDPNQVPILNQDVKMLDASWYMPDEQRNPIQEY
ncbi:hypothetical protein V6N13_109724 [Hibiscus sabdariffa]|uniref:Uncharacterized protein n=1 Tax=Hibiscus sabdariffa TaxID=183260 RepID=A0ABR2FQE0_9ROSI